MRRVQHPVGEGPAAAFHLAFAGLYACALAFHALCAWRHFRERAR